MSTSKTDLENGFHPSTSTAERARVKAAEKGNRGWYRESERQAQAQRDREKSHQTDQNDKAPLLGEGSNIRMGYRGDKFKKESTRR